MLHVRRTIKATEKPMLRWCIGGTGIEGVEVLEESVRLVKKLYQDEFKLVICWNKMNEEKLQRLKDTGVKLVHQTDYAHELATPPRGPLWALLPPRLNIDGYELFMDNDIILTKRLPHLDEWLSKDAVVYTRSYKRDAGRACHYGHYAEFVAKGNCINTGFFGLPPGLDFKTHINRVITKRGEVPIDHHNFQGIVASCLSHYHDQIQIHKKDIELCNRERDDLENWMGRFGTHFIHVNNGRKKHLGWAKYKKLKTEDKLSF